MKIKVAKQLFVIVATVLILLVSAVTAGAYETEDAFGGSDVYNGIMFDYYTSVETNEEYIVITGAEEALSGALNIPSKITVDYSRSVPVRIIAAEAFYWQSMISVSIPASVRIIESRAFDNCTQLKSVTFANGIESIEESAFANCTALKSVVIPNSVTNLGEDVFRDCENLTSVAIGTGVKTLTSAFSCTGITEFTIPETVKTIADGAFTACLDLKSVHIGSNVEEIGTAFIRTLELEEITVSENNNSFTVIDGALYTKDGTALVAYPQKKAGTSFVVRNGVEKINAYAINYSQYLTSVTVPDGVTSIGKSAFTNSQKLTDVSLPSSLKEIGSWAFSESKVLAQISLPNGLESIGEYAFYKCGKLTSLSIPDSVKGTLGDCTFGSCTSLENVYIGSGIEEIKQWQFNPFMDCSKLNNITVSPLNKYYTSVDGNLYSKDKKQFIKYAAGKADLAFTMADGVEVVDDFAFDAANNLTSIVLADSVQSMGAKAIYNCTSLVYTTIDGASYIPSVTNQYHTLVSVASSTKELVLDKTKVIRPGAFASASVIWKVTIGDDITEIPAELFANKRGLTYVTLGKSVTSIGAKAFYNCDGLRSINLPDSLTSIGESAFYNCSDLDGDLIIPDGVTEIKDGTFYYCSYLDSVTLGKNVTSVGENVFTNLINARSINIPATLKSIGSNTFKNFGSSINGLKVYVEDLAAYCKIDFGSNTANPFNYLYTDKTELYIGDVLTTEIVIPNEITEIKNYAFYRTPITALKLNDKIEIIGIQALAYCPITEISLPDSLKEIKYSAFYTAHITEITLGDNLEYIGQYAFNGSYLKKVTFGSCTPFVDYNAFYRVYIKEVHTNDLAAWCSTEFYGSDANPLTQSNALYYNGELVTELVVPDGVTTIGEHTFCNYTQLTRVHIPDSVKEIANYAFDGCTKLAEVFVGNGMESITKWAFYNCKAIEKVLYHGTPEKWAIVSADSGKLSTAAVTYVRKVTLVDENGVAAEKYCEYNKPVCSSQLGIDAYGYETLLYTDAQHTKPFGSNEVLLDDITLYYVYKPVAHTLTTVTGNEFSVELKYFDESEGGSIAVALYAENRLVGLKIAKCDLDGATVVFDSSLEYDSAKILVWNELGLSPLTKPEILINTTELQ